jgi:hypothetical protein
MFYYKNPMDQGDETEGLEREGLEMKGLEKEGVKRLLYSLFKPNLRNL